MAKAAAVTPPISHWSTLVENFNTSTKDFYTSVEQNVKTRQLPDVNLSRVDWKEGGMFSASREYLRIKRKKLIFDVCGAPYGNGFFVSWWLAAKPDGLWALAMGIPIVCWPAYFLYKFSETADTYYQRDTTSMFQTAIHQSVLQAVDEMTSANGVRQLTELERKPIMRELFQQN